MRNRRAIEMAASGTVHHRSDQTAVFPTVADSETPVEPYGDEVWVENRDSAGPLWCVELETVATEIRGGGEHDG